MLHCRFSEFRRNGFAPDAVPALAPTRRIPLRARFFPGLNQWSVHCALRFGEGIKLGTRSKGAGHKRLPLVLASRV